jgi:hypothetical protein
LRMSEFERRQLIAIRNELDLLTPSELPPP